MGFGKSALEDLGMNPDFWVGKKVFLTGHTGFKGSWLALWLQNLGAKVMGYSLSIPTIPSLFQLAKISTGMASSIEGDVRDFAHLKQTISKFQPEIVIHMAAQSLVQMGYQDPITTYSTNVIGTVHLLQAIREVGSARVIVNVTSDKCYSSCIDAPRHRETDLLGGDDPYSNSKACSELVTTTFRNAFFNLSDFERHGTALASVRSGNVIGGGDWASDRLIPDFVRAVMSKHPLIIRNPNAVRPWQHVLESLSGYLLLAEKLWQDGPRYAESWNFGPLDKDFKPVSWIVKQLVHLWGEDVQWELDVAHHFKEQTYLKLDCTKARSKLGWIQRANLEQALEWTIEWYKEYKQESDMRKFTEAQIATFNTVLTP